jgi:regulator of sigma E protease
MIVSILYIILAILGLSFLIFIHELGHYYVARRLGMRVETFSIGFGKPIYSWYKDGVRWQIGWLLFGGYVKIAGMETQDARDIYDVQDGFFGKKPLDRIKVALAGPLVNIAFALVAFTLLWSIGGREKNFSDFTHKLGSIRNQSFMSKEFGQAMRSWLMAIRCLIQLKIIFMLP